MRPISEMASAWKALANPYILVFSAIIDTAFLFLYGFLTQPVRDQILNNAVFLADVTGSTLQAAGRTLETPSLMEVLFAPAAKPHLIGVILWMLVLLVVAYAIYVIIQGLAWRVASNSAGKKISWTQFALLNIPWFIIGGILYFFLTVIDLRAVIVEAMTNTPVSAVTRSIFLGLFSLTIYFALISYGELQQHNWKKAFTNSFKRGIGKITTILPATLVIIVLFLIINYILILLFNLNQAIGFIVGLVILLPTLFWSRILIYHTVRDEEHGVHQQS